MTRFLAAAISVALAASASAEPLKIRADYVASPEKAAAILPMAAAHGGVLAHYGKSYTLEVTQMAGGGVILTARV